jgi:hypothetical protein
VRFTRAAQHLHRHPFAWTATADSILGKLRRLCKAIGYGQFPFPFTQEQFDIPTGYITWVIGRSVLDLTPALLPQPLVNVIAGAASTACVSAS